MMDDLCNRLADNLDDAFGEVVTMLADDVYSGLRQMAGLHEAEDLTQETFIRAYGALRTYERSRIRHLRLRGWIWTIALNLGRNHARDRSRRPTPVALEDRHAVHDPEPPDSAAWNRRLSALSPTLRTAVVLRHVVGLDYADIAEATGRAEGTVKSDVHRALRKLRSIMEEEA